MITNILLRHYLKRMKFIYKSLKQKKNNYIGRLDMDELLIIVKKS